MPCPSGAHLPYLGHWAHRWKNHDVCHAWLVRRHTYGYLPSRTASPALGRYQIILLGDRGIGEWTTCLELLPDSSPNGNRTHDCFIASPKPQPLRHQAWWCYIGLANLATMTVMMTTMMMIWHCTYRQWKTLSTDVQHPEVCLVFILHDSQAADCMSLHTSIY